MRFFQYSCINTVWRILDVFVVHTPYKRKVLNRDFGALGNDFFYDSFSEADCKKVLGGRRHSATSIYPTGDCGPDGMSFVIAATDTPVWTSDIAPAGTINDINLVGQHKLNYHDIIASSVSGWKNFGFEGNISNKAYEAIVSGAGNAWTDISLADMTRFNQIGPRDPGIFNIPVCQTFDLRFFIGQQDAEDQPDWGAFCLASAANSPAKTDETFRKYGPKDAVSYMVKTHTWGGDTWIGDKWEKVPHN